jgi:hypothetical protein
MFRVVIKVLFFIIVAFPAGLAGAVEFSAAERALIAQHGPWPMQFAG